jgi:serine/threonine protein phosphatase PrpC
MNLVNFSAESHQGPFLEVNEDGYDFDFNENLYMVFDGYGGNGIGDKCVENLKNDIKKFYKNFVVDRNATLPFFYSSKYLLEGNALINASLLAHSNLHKENITKNVGQRAGASGIIISKYESILTLVMTGNCRAYILKNGKLISLFTDDSFQYLTKDHYNSHLKNVPLSGFGLFPDLHYQVKEVRVSPGDKVITLTDGVYSRVEEQEIIAAILKPSISIKTKINELFKLSNDRGNLDNQTCMIIEY